MNKYANARIVVGATKLLCGSTINQNPDAWGSLFLSIMSILNVKRVRLTIGSEDQEGKDFDAAYSKLKNAQVSDVSINAEILAAPQYFITQLSALCASRPGTYIGVIQGSLGGDTTGAGDRLQELLGQYQLSLQ